MLCVLLTLSALLRGRYEQQPLILYMSVQLMNIQHGLQHKLLVLVLKMPRLCGSSEDS